MDAPEFSFDFDIPPSNAAPSASESRGNQINPADTASGAILSERRSTRGRTKGSRTRSAVGEGGGAVALTPEEQRALEELFKPQQWKGLVRAPADAALFLTGSKAWELSESETDQLAIGAATTARYFAPSHPKWLALSLFAMSLITVYGSHFIAWRLEQKTRNVVPKSGGVVSPFSKEGPFPKDGTLNN